MVQVVVVGGGGGGGVYTKTPQGALDRGTQCALSFLTIDPVSCVYVMKRL